MEPKVIFHLFCFVSFVEQSYMNMNPVVHSGFQCVCCKRTVEIMYYKKDIILKFNCISLISELDAKKFWILLTWILEIMQSTLY